MNVDEAKELRQDLVNSRLISLAYPTATRYDLEIKLAIITS